MKMIFHKASPQRSYHFWLILFSLCLVMHAEAQRKKPAYSEDLQKHRPVLPPVQKPSAPQQEKQKIPAQFTVNEKVNGVLDSIDRFNATKKFIDGFTIQIYSGQKKQEALDINKTLIESGSALTADIQFVQPKFRVVVGKYYTRLSAHRDLRSLLKLFPNAIIIPEKVPLK
jgi:hypothetical protein